MSGGAAGEQSLAPDGSSTSLRALEEECRALADRAEQAQRELRSLRAELEVKDEYIATFESELSLLQARLDEALGHLRTKTAHIQSLPSVRLKTWVTGRRRGPQG